MNIVFLDIEEFIRGTIFDILKDAYSFDKRYEGKFKDSWKQFDKEIYDNLEEIKNRSFITALNDKPIGFIYWKNIDGSNDIKIGYNCIVCDYKNNGYGKIQLEEAKKRIIKSNPKNIIITADDSIIPAIRMCEGCGFSFFKKRESKNNRDLISGYSDYVYLL